MKTILNREMKAITSLAFLLVLTLTPILGYAKENEKSDKNNKNENHVCLKAFGKFVKNGWRQTKGQISLNTNCHLPYGIFKKLNFNPAPSSDIIAPVINLFTVIPQNTKAEVNWTANERSRAVVFYGTTTPNVVKATTTTNSDILKSVYTTNAMTLVDNVNIHTNGKLTIKNLLPDTTYFTVLAVRDSAGNVTVSNTVTFKTTHSSDTNAPIINNILTTISLNKLLISWKTNEPATSKLFYGTTTLNIVATSTLNMNNATLKTNHSFELPIIASTTPYHVILQSVDASGNTTTSAEYSIYLPF